MGKGVSLEYDGSPGLMFGLRPRASLPSLTTRGKGRTLCRFGDNTLRFPVPAGRGSQDKLFENFTDDPPPNANIFNLINLPSSMLSYLVHLKVVKRLQIFCVEL